MSNEIVPYRERIKTVMGLLAAKKNQMAVALPRHITVERMLGVAMRSIQKTPRLLDCEPTSLIAAVMQSAQMGLECDGVLGQAFLVPFKKSVVLVPGYKGLIKLARNSGDIATIQAHEVHEKDTFKFHYGLDPILEHIPTADADPGKIVAFYAVAKLKDGSTQFEVMWARQVNEIRDRSQGYKSAKQYNSSTPWETDYAEMGKKTVLRRLCKMLPSSTELQRAVSLDEQADAGLPQEFDIDIEPLTAESDGGNGKSKLDAIAEAGKPPEPPATKPTAPPATKPEEPKPKGRAAAPKAPEGNPNYADSEPEPENLFQK